MIETITYRTKRIRTRTWVMIGVAVTAVLIAAVIALNTGQPSAKQRACQAEATSIAKSENRINTIVRNDGAAPLTIDRRAFIQKCVADTSRTPADIYQQINSGS